MDTEIDINRGMCIDLRNICIGLKYIMVNRYRENKIYA